MPRQERHKWTDLERSGFAAFVHSLPQERLDEARDRQSMPESTADEIVAKLSGNGDEFHRVRSAFDPRKKQITAHFKSIKPASDLPPSRLDNLNIEQLWVYLESYATQVYVYTELG